MVLGELEERFWSKVEKTSTCWLWKASMYPNGYGAFKCYGKTRGAHRIAWEIVNGSIPKNLLVCHTCDVRACVNPDHLFLGSYKDNVQDMVTKQRYNSANGNKEVCKRGHVFTLENTIIKKKGRQCRLCQRMLNREYMRRKRTTGL